MNVYKALNEVTLYIDEHLEEKIDTHELAKKLGVNAYTFERLFSLLSGYSITEYIRMRRLSSAALDIYNEECFVIDVALKYGYESATAFSRAFTKFHGVKPSKIEKLEDLKIFPRMVFDEDVQIVVNSEVQIVEKDEITLYGLGIKTDNDKINDDAPEFFKTIEDKYMSELGPIKYAIVLYDGELREECTDYYVLYEHKLKGFEKMVIPGGKYLFFRVQSQEPKDIQKVSKDFYYTILPSCKYNLRDTPEVEYYHDGVTDFLVPIL